jgi:cytochrome c2
MFALAQGDAYRGAQVLEKQNCLHCHSIQGQGGKIGPDLGRRTTQQYTPAVMTSVMWNHAPAMWSAMTAEHLARPELSEHDANDLFAYFYAVRFFEKPGEAERGKIIFESKHCAECHSLGSGSSKGPGNPVPMWTSVNDPIILIQQMWNHSSLMKRAFEAKGYEWVSLTGQDLVDLTVYLQNLPFNRGKRPAFSLPGSKGGEALLAEKGCNGCHTGSLELDKRLHDESLTDVAAALWNHAPRMVNAPMISQDEMRLIISYVWEKQYLGVPGNAGRGKRVFEKKSCATCHTGQGGAPQIVRAEKVFTPVTMVAVLWKHGPAMLERMHQQKIDWPRLTPGDVSDLVAFLNTKP